MRTLGVYSVKDGTINVKADISTNISPATLMPYFDPDTKLLFVSGKVDHLCVIPNSLYLQWFSLVNVLVPL